MRTGLCDAAGLPPADGGAASSAAPRKRRLTDDKLSPSVLQQWVDKVAEERQALVRAASASPPRPYADWLADPESEGEQVQDALAFLLDAVEEEAADAGKEHLRKRKRTEAAPQL